MNDNQTASYWIEKLGLKHHPEGGWFKEIYRSGETIPSTGLPDRFPGPRCFLTSIYFLLEKPDFSTFHRIKSDEIWHFYAGDALAIHVIDANGNDSRLLLGRDPEKNEHLQVVVPAGAWFAAEVCDPGSFALVGCAVAPGFDFEDFEIAEAEALCDLYPEQTELIERLTRRKE